MCVCVKLQAVINSLTHSLTPCSTVLPEKLEGPQLVKKFPAFYGTDRFITAFTTAHHISMSPRATSWRAISILSSQIRLSFPSVLFTSGLSTKSLHAPHLPLTRATCPAQLLVLIIRIIFGEHTEHKAPLCVVFSTHLASSLLTFWSLTTYIYISYRSANLQTLHFKYLFNKYT